MQNLVNARKDEGVSVAPQSLCPFPGQITIITNIKDQIANSTEKLIYTSLYKAIFFFFDNEVLKQFFVLMVGTDCQLWTC